MINKATLLGYVGGEAKVRVGGSGTEVMQFSMATEESWKDKQGAWQKKATWHNIVVFSPSADQKANIAKGALLYVEGKINVSENEKDGKKYRNVDIYPKTIKILNRKAGAGGAGAGQDEDFIPEPF